MLQFLKENEALGNKLFDEDGKVDTLDKMKTALYIDNKMTSEILKGFSRKIFSQNKKFENFKSENDTFEKRQACLLKKLSKQ